MQHSQNNEDLESAEKFVNKQYIEYMRTIYVAQVYEDGNTSEDEPRLAYEEEADPEQFEEVETGLNFYFKMYSETKDKNIKIAIKKVLLKYENHILEYFEEYEAKRLKRLSESYGIFTFLNYI
jgi:hypothetical protein